uniref:Uncharacterized protein n=1 Tax=Rhizophora mucronata TaxID=61149 RepID=A0A2P2P1J5_RHIMU
MLVLLVFRTASFILFWGIELNSL